MRGYIRQRGSTWQVVVSAGFDPVTGKRVQIFATARTREEADRELTRLLRQQDTGSSANPGALTVGRYVMDQWLPHQASRVRARTLNRYRQLLTIHVVPAIGGVKLSKLRPAHVQSMIDSLPVGARTKVHVYRVTSAALRHAVRVRLLDSNPADGARPPRPDRPSLTVPESPDVNRLLEAADGWLHTALSLSAGTGMRRGEVLALQWRSVDLDGRRARVEQAMENIGPTIRFVLPKTDRGRRTVALPAGTVAILRAVKKDQAERRLLLGEAWSRTDLVVEHGDGSPIHPDLYSTRFARLAASVGLGAVRLHDIRHYYASELLRANVHPKVVSEGLGHASTAFTMDVYSHLLPSMQERAADAIEASLYGSSPMA
jgi:integrase